MTTPTPTTTPAAATTAAGRPTLPAPAGTVLHQQTDPAGGHASAVTDTTGTYRYALTRTWNPDKTVACWIMLNPSTADHAATDATLTRAVAFTARAGCGGLIIINLFALRSTDPRALRNHKDPVGPHNDAFIHAVVANPDCTGPVIAAWGAQGTLHDRAATVAGFLRTTGTGLNCYGTTGPQSGHQPRHPLYLDRTTHLRPYTPGQSS